MTRVEWMGGCSVGWTFLFFRQNFSITILFGFCGFSKLMVEFIEKVPKDRLIKTKMLCIDQIIQTELFKLPGIFKAVCPFSLWFSSALFSVFYFLCRWEGEWGQVFVSAVAGDWGGGFCHC